jgi:hypothetical protein
MAIVTIVTPFTIDIHEDNKAARNTNGKAHDVDKRVGELALKIAYSNKQIVL